MRNLLKQIGILRQARLRLEAKDVQLENIEAGLIFYPRLTLPWCSLYKRKCGMECERVLLLFRMKFFKEKTKNHY